jgi:hypothetical protein
LITGLTLDMLTRIYSYDELKERARKPTLWIKRLGFRGHNPNNIKLKTASLIPCPEQLKSEREKAEKAMNLNFGF